MKTIDRTHYNWKWLQSRISRDFYWKILKQKFLGDGDWIIDIINELDYVEPDSPFFLPEFHGRLLGVTTKFIDPDLIYKEVDADLELRLKERRIPNLKDWEQELIQNSDYGPYEPDTLRYRDDGETSD